MDWDRRVCSRARRSRDPRFDGRIFIGVLSTRIYCRTICPARTANERNVRYFPSAAAASEAGFRPCLRCRPECSPGTPAWMGTSSTARTRRLHFAKKLIDETTLPMNQVALAAGFGTVRRFNAAIRDTYDRTPTQIRRLARRPAKEPPDEYVFRLRYRAPYDWAALLAFLAARATPGVEVVEGGSYRRTITVEGVTGSLEVSLDEPADSILLRIRFTEPRSLFFIVERVRQMFDLAADPLEIAAHLGRDKALAGRVAGAPGLRVPGCWDGFELAVRAVLGQQVTVKGATTLAGRLVREFGTLAPAGRGLTHVFPAPARLAESDVSRIGMPRARAETIRALSRATRDGSVSFAAFTDTSDFHARFRQLPGIGEWTAQYVAMRAFADPDAFPSSDLGLLHATSLARPKELEERSQAWRPWRAYAAMHLWKPAAARGSRERTRGRIPVPQERERIEATV